MPSGPCDKGYYCIIGAWSKKPTDLGIYGYSNVTNSSQCICPNTTTGGICSPGEFCPEGSSKPTPCTQGMSEVFVFDNWMAKITLFFFNLNLN